MNFRYSMVIKWSEADNGFIVTVPEFPGLSAFGETHEEAAKEAHIAIALFVEEDIANGTPIPKPIVLS